MKWAAGYAITGLCAAFVVLWVVFIFRHWPDPYTAIFGTVGALVYGAFGTAMLADVIRARRKDRARPPGCVRDPSTHRDEGPNG